MPAYKDKIKNTWYVQYSYKDHLDGKFHGKTKRGFKTKKDALNWEIEDKNKVRGNLDMNFKSFCELYLEKQEPRLKLSTYTIKKNIIENHIIPYFSTKKVNEITAQDIMNWQTEILRTVSSNNKPVYKKSFLKTIHNQINAIFNFAVKYFDLPKNPASIVGNMGTAKEVEMEFWTKEQYMSFREVMMAEPIFFYAFECLYWLGIRKGEMLALTVEDFDFKKKEVSITKTLHVLNGKVYVTTPKTRKSVRKVKIPEFLCEEMKNYFASFYELGVNERIFPISKSSLNRALQRGEEKANLPKIRIHDLRHSHVSLLIHNGYSAVAIADRLGHESIHVTYRYAHLFPSVQEEMANSLDLSL